MCLFSWWLADRKSKLLLVICPGWLRNRAVGFLPTNPISVENLHLLHDLVLGPWSMLLILDGFMVDQWIFYHHTPSILRICIFPMTLALAITFCGSVIPSLFFWHSTQIELGMSQSLSRCFFTEIQRSIRSLGSLDVMFGIEGEGRLCAGSWETTKFPLWVLPVFSLLL